MRFALVTPGRDRGRCFVTIKGHCKSIARRLASPGDVRLRLQHPPALPGASRGKPHGLGIKGRASPEILTRSLRAAASGFTLDTETSPGPPRSMAWQTIKKHAPVIAKYYILLLHYEYLFAFCQVNTLDNKRGEIYNFVMVIDNESP